jgi:hypothetical protein
MTAAVAANGRKRCIDVSAVREMETVIDADNKVLGM